MKNKIGNAVNIRKIRGEASVRNFYRVFLKKGTLVAVVYPRAEPEEIGRIQKLTGVYRRYRIHVPEIKDIIDDRIVLQEDLGDLLLQRAFRRMGGEEKRSLLTDIAGIVTRLREIPAVHTGAVLDHARMKWEMDFFIEHFARNFCHGAADIDRLQAELHLLVNRIEDIESFAHRDFHSRNMIVCGGRPALVDFQDSLKAPLYYDTVSFAFDAYLDLKGLRTFFLDALRQRGLAIDHDQFYITALQRNIKALGTFGFQVTVRKNLSYKKYIPRTLRHIRRNPLYTRFLRPDDFTLPAMV